MIEKRSEYSCLIAGLLKEKKKTLIFVDESSFNIKLSPQYGWAPKG